MLSEKSNSEALKLVAHFRKKQPEIDSEKALNLNNLLKKFEEILSLDPSGLVN